MRQLIERTWLPTSVFVSLCTAEAVYAYRQCGRPWTILGITVSGLVLVPVIWWWVVARAKRQHAARGAAAGALCVVLSLNLAPIAEMMLWRSRVHVDQLSTGLGGLEVFIMLMLSVSVGGPIGGLLGALMATLQKRWWPRTVRQPAAPDEARQEWTPGDGAIAGVVFGAIGGVFGCFYSLSRPETSHDPSSVIVNLGALWLLMVPSAAVLGATVVALRKWGGIARRALRRATIGSPILSRELKWWS